MNATDAYNHTPHTAHGNLPAALWYNDTPEVDTLLRRVPTSGVSKAGCLSALQVMCMIAHPTTNSRREQN